MACNKCGSPDTYELQSILSVFLLLVFGFFLGQEIVLPEQGESSILEIGFIKGGNVQSLTGIDTRNTARFGITVAGSASKWELLSISHQSVRKYETHMKQWLYVSIAHQE